MQSASELCADFENALKKIGGALASPIQHSTWTAPHSPSPMPVGFAAVYVFFLNRPSMPTRVLKVGKAGPKSGPRFLSQHYNFSARGTLAKAILFNPILWGEIGIERISKVEVNNWIKTNTGRMNFFLNSQDQKWLPQLEIFLRGKLSPMMEGVQTKEVLT